MFHFCTWFNFKLIIYNSYFYHNSVVNCILVALEYMRSLSVFCFTDALYILILLLFII